MKSTNAMITMKIKHTKNGIAHSEYGEQISAFELYNGNPTDRLMRKAYDLQRSEGNGTTTLFADNGSTIERLATYTGKE